MGPNNEGEISFGANSELKRDTWEASNLRNGKNGVMFDLMYGGVGGSDP